MSDDGAEDGRDDVKIAKWIGRIRASTRFGQARISLGSPLPRFCRTLSGTTSLSGSAARCCRPKLARRRHRSPKLRVSDQQRRSCHHVHRDQPRHLGRRGGGGKAPLTPRRAPPTDRAHDTGPGGGIGRRASFRCWCPYGRGGSSPLLGTTPPSLPPGSPQLFWN